MARRSTRTTVHVEIADIVRYVLVAALILYALSTGRADTIIASIVSMFR